MTLFWVFFVLGSVYATALIGNFYALINPWTVIVERIEALGFDLSKARKRYPPWLAYWPALFLYVAWTWIEQFTVPTPRALSSLLLIYSAITLIGVMTYGRKTWFSRAEVFAVLFELVGKLAPLKYSAAADGRSWSVLRQHPFSTISSDRPTSMSILLFVLFMLSSTTYDSIHDTALWTAIFFGRGR